MDEFKLNLKNLIEQNTEKSNAEVFVLLESYKAKLYELLYRDGETLLHWACAFNNAIVCEWLIENGLHVNFENYRGTSPLYYACMNNAKESIKTMMKHRVNPFQRGGFSGDFPITILTDDETIAMLESYSHKNFPFINIMEDESLKFNIINKKGHRLAYKYRIYMNARSIAFYLQNPNKHSLQDRDLSEYMDLYDKEGIVGLMKVCEKLYTDYFDELANLKEGCLYCDNTLDLKQCSKCKLVVYCNQDCQKKAFKYHKFDCASLKEY